MEVTYEGFERDNVLTSDVMAKYQTASEIAYQVMEGVLSKCQPMVSIVELCKMADEAMVALTRPVFEQCERGIAFPCCITPNHLVQNFSPMDDVKLQSGQMIKIELGVHVDGYIASCAHTMIVGSTEVTEGRQADVVCAAWLASQVVLKKMKAGARCSDLVKTIQQVANVFHCQPVMGTGSYLVKRYIMEGEKCIQNLPTTETLMDDFELEQGQVYALNILMSTGTGRVRESNKYPSQLFQRDANTRYALKLKNSRATLTEVESNYGIFPFPARSLFEKRSLAKMGLQECVEHGVIVPLPILEEKSTVSDPVYIAQYKFTVMMTENGVLMKTLPLPWVASDYSLDETEYGYLLKGVERMEE